MARTDPVYRRRGVATFLQQQIYAHARCEGINALRLWTSSINTASIRACEKGGFRMVCDAAALSTIIRKGVKRKRLHKPQDSAPRALIDSALKSKYLTKMNGYVGRKWQIIQLNKDVLTKLVSNDELYVVDDAVFLTTKPEKRFRHPQSSLTILDGPASKSFREAKDVARRLGTRILSSYIPYDRYQISVAKRLGYRRNAWGKHCYVFEKTVK